MQPVATWQEQTSKPDETRHIGVRLGQYVQAGDFIACCGPLGAGKTTLVQGLATGLEVKGDEYVRSPTFALVHEYRGRYPLYHFDFYRLSHWSEAQDIGFMDYLDGQGVVIIEWADKFPQLLPTYRLDIYLQVLPAGDRSIHLAAYDTAYARFIHLLSKVYTER
jgi:tRNA threonylcarbamoyladenosine biosynthesis protein TsaE